MLVEPEIAEAPRPSSIPPRACVFPPALVPVLRERLGPAHQSLVGVDDAVLGELLTAVFFAGLQTHEGSHHPVRVAFAGRQRADVLLPDGEAQDATPMLFYRWSTLRIEPDRPFGASELVRLGVVTHGDRMYTKVELSDRGLRVVGFAREGLNREGDPYLKVVAPRPGVLSLGRGNERLVEYEHGRLGDRAEDVILAAGVLRRSLEQLARDAGLGDATIGDYLHTVRALVRAMAAHGHGGILVIGSEASPEVPAGASYRTRNDSTLGQLLEYLDGAADARRAAEPPGSSAPGSVAMQLRRVLRGAFANEVDRWVSELGWFTAADGATVLDCALGLRGFGVVLPVAREIEVVEALDAEATAVSVYDLSTRGTRHRAAVTYAKRFPGSVVFIASHDGPVSCLLGSSKADEPVTLWRLGSGEFG